MLPAEPELFADEILKAGWATEQCLGLSDPLSPVTGRRASSQPPLFVGRVLGTESVLLLLSVATVVEKGRKGMYPQWSPAVICVLTNHKEAVGWESPGQMQVVRCLCELPFQEEKTI